MAKLLANPMRDEYRLRCVERCIRIAVFVSNSRLGVTAEEVRQYLESNGDPVCERTAARACHALKTLGMIRSERKGLQSTKYFRGAFRVEFAPYEQDQSEQAGQSEDS